MSTVVSMTTEQLLAMPEDNGVERQLFRGELREKPITRRNRFHARAVTRIAFLLERWRCEQAQPFGEVHAGEVGVILRRAPDTMVGIDIAFFSAETMARQTNETPLVEGVPELAVEVLSPSDKHEEIRDKVLEYLDVGVREICIVDPDFKTVQVHQPGAAPVSYNREQEMQCRALPGLTLAIAEIFPD